MTAGRTTAIDAIAGAFRRRGGEFYGEDLSQLDHALQCAWLAREAGAGDHLIVAALLHDYGHLLNEPDGDEGDARHETLGARALKPWFGRRVAGPIALHVQAKRYLCAIEPGYEAALSAASVQSLRSQGGPFTEPQCRQFERRHFSADAIRLRRWDDSGKAPSMSVVGLDHYLPLLERLYCD